MIIPRPIRNRQTNVKRERLIRKKEREAVSHGVVSREQAERWYRANHVSKISENMTRIFE